MIAILLCFSAAFAQAQHLKGSGLIGGSFSFGTASTLAKPSGISDFSVLPTIGYFLSNNVVVGADLSYNLSKLRNGRYYNYFDENGFIQQGYGFEEQQFGFSPFAKMYSQKVAFFRFFAQADFGIFFKNYSYLDRYNFRTGFDISYEGVNANLSPGLAFAMSKDFNIEFSVPLVSFFNTRNTAFDSYGNSSQGFVTALDNFAPRIGVSFFVR